MRCVQRATARACVRSWRRCSYRSPTAWGASRRRARDPDRALAAGARRDRGHDRRVGDARDEPLEPRGGSVHRPRLVRDPPTASSSSSRLRSARTSGALGASGGQVHRPREATDAVTSKTLMVASNHATNPAALAKAVENTTSQWDGACDPRRDGPEPGSSACRSLCEAARGACVGAARDEARLHGSRGTWGIPRGRDENLRARCHPSGWGSISTRRIDEHPSHRRHEGQALPGSRERWIPSAGVVRRHDRPAASAWSSCAISCEPGRVLGGSTVLVRDSLSLGP